MTTSTLIMHRGGRKVDRSELALVETPMATDSWFPVGHSMVVDTIERQLDEAGFAIRKAEFGLSSDNGRLFATLDLMSTLADGVALAAGVRNSIDKSLPLGFVAGSRTFVCDNLSFSSELTVARKHTRNGQERFGEAIALAVQALGQFQTNEAARIEFMKAMAITDQMAESLMLRAFETEIVSNRLLPRVIQEWREPSFPDFRPRNAWSLYNAFTTAMGPRATSNPQQHAALTIRLGGLFGTDGAALSGKPLMIEGPVEPDYVGAEFDPID